MQPASFSMTRLPDPLDGVVVQGAPGRLPLGEGAPARSACPPGYHERYSNVQAAIGLAGLELLDVVDGDHAGARSLHERGTRGPPGRLGAPRARRSRPRLLPVLRLPARSGRPRGRVPAPGPGRRVPPHGRLLRPAPLRRRLASRPAGPTARPTPCSFPSTPASTTPRWPWSPSACGASWTAPRARRARLHRVSADEPRAMDGARGLPRRLRGDGHRGRGRLRGGHRPGPPRARSTPAASSPRRPWAARSATSSTSTRCADASDASSTGFPKWIERRDRIIARVRQNASAMILACRFLPGLRVAIPAACACADVSPVRFSTLSLISSLGWAAAVMAFVTWLGPASFAELGVRAWWTPLVPGLPRPGFQLVAGPAPAAKQDGPGTGTIS